MSGCLSLLTAVGGGVNTPALSASYTITSTAGNPASFNLLSTGVGNQVVDGVTTPFSGQWLTTTPDSTTAALYEVRRTQVSGTLGITFTGTMADGVWYQLNADRGVTATAGGAGRSNVSTWDIRLIAGPGPIVATASVTVASNP